MRNEQVYKESPRPERLRMGRLLRAKTQKDIAKETGIDQALISKYENGRSITSEDFQKIAQKLELPESFFYRQGTTSTLHGADMVMFRRRKSASKRIQDQVTMELSRICENIEVLFDSVDVHVTDIPFYEPKNNSTDEMEDIAGRVRLDLRIPQGPIQSMTRIMESMGIVIVERQLPYKVDALIQPSIHHKITVLLLSSELLGGRQRFSLAHELGHLIMHGSYRFSYDETEAQANAFASALLMPAFEIKPQLRTLTMEKLIALSAQWKVSAQALVYRAQDLGVLSKQQAEGWYKRLNQRGYSKAEITPIQKETPSLMKALINIHLTELKYTIEDLSDILSIYEWEFRERYLGEKVLRVFEKKPKLYMTLDNQDTG